MFNSQVVQLSIAFLLVILLVVGCAHGRDGSDEDNRTNVLENIRVFINSIPDKARADQMNTLLDELAESLAGLNQTNMDFKEDFLKLQGDYDATKDDFRALNDNYDRTRLSFQREVLDSYFGIKELATPEEWGNIVALDKKRLKEILR